MKNITEIYCPNCGAPAHFDIENQIYLCRYCDSRIQTGEALREKQGFRKIHADKLKNDVKKFRLSSATCNNCGATVMFEENEPLSDCGFCGSSLVLSEYLDTENFPECIIPFAITENEAKQRLSEWCEKNSSKREAKKLRDLIPQLKGYYLPYELVRGPVHMHVSRISGKSVYDCEGHITDEFVNRSKQLDNLLLDGMEPFDMESLVDFDFSYVAGHHVKICDTNDSTLESRIQKEVSRSYTPAVRKTLDTRAVNVNAEVNDALRYPVLLPVYYICEGNIMAAVNGQAGKVSVRAEKESHYHFMPWWFKAIISILVLCGITFGVCYLLKLALPETLFISGTLGFFFYIVVLCLFSDTTRNKFSVEAGREIYTSGEQTFHREKGGLVQNETILKRKVSKPVYFYKVNGIKQPVELKFATPLRFISMILLAMAILFLPVIFALLINGFNFSNIHLGGSAVWFCIFVPVVPILLLKVGIVELYEHPWIYYRNEKGRKKRYRGEKKKFKIDGETIMAVLVFVFVPPSSLAVWFGLICFAVMVYLTAGFGW